MKKKFNKKIMYASDTGWYINTYHALGHQWMLQAILQAGIKTGDVIVSPSANRGLYESDVLEDLERMNIVPEFYLGDLFKSDLDLVPSRDHFHWIAGNGCDAAKLKIALSGDHTLPDKADVILDIKGAVWHTIYDHIGDEDVLLHDLNTLLRTYVSLLRSDDSVLILDYYEFPWYYDYISLPLMIYDRIRGSRTKEIKISHFQENSTFECIRWLMRKSKIYAAFGMPGKLSPSSLQMKHLMNTMAIKRSDLENLIEQLDQIQPKKAKRRLKCIFRCQIVRQIVLYEFSFLWLLCYLLMH